MELPESRSGQGAGGAAACKLVVSAPLLAQDTGFVSMLVERGMPVSDCDGRPAGRVAGLVCDAAVRAATHLIVARWQAALDYRVVPIEQVSPSARGGVRLAASLSALDSLPTWSQFSQPTPERSSTHDKPSRGERARPGPSPSDSPERA
ncbi:MAG: hypothetical protein IT318_16740 [Anaerolineales bacterium]|nr:hypothetical protein [Anaerolineales bacterium]